MHICFIALLTFLINCSILDNMHAVGYKLVLPTPAEIPLKEGNTTNPFSSKPFICLTFRLDRVSANQA